MSVPPSELDGRRLDQQRHHLKHQPRDHGHRDNAHHRDERNDNQRSDDDGVEGEHSGGPALREQRFMQTLQGDVAWVRDLVAYELGDPRVADASVGGDLFPVAAPNFQSGTNFRVKSEVHCMCFAKFCGSYSQHIAHTTRKTLRVQKNSIVDLVAAALKRRMAEKEIPSANQLGALSGVAPNTVSNFLYPEKREVSASGKQPSGKLTELEMICSALGTDVPGLLSAAHENVAPQAQPVSHRERQDTPTASAVGGGQQTISPDEIFKAMSVRERVRFARLLSAAFDDPPEIGVTVEGDLWVRNDLSNAQALKISLEPHDAKLKPVKRASK